MAKKIKILFSPLDWGLGHATRCIPLLKRLQKNGHEIIIASAGKPETLLRKEFPGIHFVELPGYNITYSKYKRFFPFKILWQVPKIYSSVKKENKILQKLIDEYNIDLVISDNRFGLYSKKTPCIFITHQLYIKAPFKWIEKIIYRINYHYINKFSECWVPDFEMPPNLSGQLSHPSILPSLPVIYIGPLSRFDELQGKEVKYAAAIILSGPEPQRTLLEKKVVEVFKKNKEEKFLLIRGMPGNDETTPAFENITIYNHLDTAGMQEAIAQSGFIISRCGYTTVMEMLSLKKKTILIPTPGQTEQEYLASYLMHQQWAFCCTQNDDLEVQYSLAKEFNYQLSSFNHIQMEKIIEERIAKLLSHN